MITIVGLALFGLAMISSVSVFESNNLTFEIEGKKIIREHYVAGENDFESERAINNLGLDGVKQNLTAEEMRKVNELASNDFYLWNHFWHILLGLVIFYICMHVPYQWWRKWGFYMFLVSVALLVLVLSHWGADYGTARSWLNLPGLPSVQPSEFAKLSLIIYLSSWLDQRETEVASFEGGFVPFVFIMGVTALLLAMQPDFGSLLVVVCISAAIYFTAGANVWHLVFGAGVAGILALPVFLNSDYIRNRFLAFIDPESDTLGIGYQVLNALIAIGSGGLTGAGFGRSVQKFGYLPEVQSDSIFSAVAEELGFLKLVVILGAFGVIAWRGYGLAEKCGDRFGKLLATGITSWIIFQTIINIGVNLALLPTTGITLPFVSHGGSSLIALLAAGGILVNISKGSLVKVSNENFGNRRRVGRSHFPRLSRGRKTR